MFVLISEIINLIKYLQDLLKINPEELLNTLNLLTDKFILKIDNKLFSFLKNNIISTLKYLVTVSLNYVSTLLQYLLHLLAYIPSATIALICTVMSTYFFIKNLIIIDANKYLKSIFPNKKEKIIDIFLEVRKTLINYLLVYLIIIFTSSAITFIGFSILNVNYSLFLSILSGILDLLPILGIALVYIPLIIFYLINQNYFVAISLLILYCLISFLRQIIEPKLISSSLGIHPIASLAAMFIGLQLQGFLGFIFCLFFIIFYNIMKKVKLI